MMFQDGVQVNTLSEDQLVERFQRNESRIHHPAFRFKYDEVAQLMCENEDIVALIHAKHS